MSLLRKFVAPEFIYGEGARKLAGQYAQNFGAKRVFVVSDPGVIAAGWTQEVVDSLQEAGLSTVLYDSVTANPRSEEVGLGARRFRDEACDVIVAVGGGSPMDAAKAIGIVSTNGGSVEDFEGVDEVDVPGPPLICVPTTAGTAADVSQFAIITVLHRRTKIAIISKTVVPDVALVDPVTSTTMDRYLTACTGMDAMVHAIEAFLSSASSSVTDLHALEAIRLLSGNLRAVHAHPMNMDARDAIMRGSLGAGLAFSNASLGAVHAMAHSLGGLLDLPHGECNSILLSHVVRFNHAATPERVTEVGKAMGLDLRGLTTKEVLAAVLSAIETLRRDLGIDPSLATRGVSLGDIPDLAQNAMMDVCMATNPRLPVPRDVEVIYEEAL